MWNRTAAKAKPLLDRGATPAEAIGDLAASDVVFVMVSGPDNLNEVIHTTTSAERLGLHELVMSAVVNRDPAKAREAVATHHQRTLEYLEQTRGAARPSAHASTGLAYLIHAPASLTAREEWSTGPQRGDNGRCRA